ncbi:gluconate 2-dehydrogenase subunit 3 family protein [Flavobacterium sp. 83]|uniref:gluconate 2-dehydrogenase subunit 3 family protein n=1 Tax=Flavobacterium sp. 83 TaxID=1131812 RepID=UPI000556538C|nr:gluconate 2-dehydrogenase subunit 3 family protein [Flavobacterium sp. 83]
MDRRRAIKNLALVLGGVISATTVGILIKDYVIPDNENSKVSFSPTDEALLAEFADIIIPTTKAAPGAKAAGLGSFIPMMVNECYPSDLQQIFSTGMKEMEEKCQKEYSKNFISLSAEERVKIMEHLRTESLVDTKKPSFFIIARDLTILGYFSSEIGCTQAREYIAVPGRYDGSADYKPGQKAWAT